MKVVANAGGSSRGSAGGEGGLRSARSQRTNGHAWATERTSMAIQGLRCGRACLIPLSVPVF